MVACITIYVHVTSALTSTRCPTLDIDLHVRGLYMHIPCYRAGIHVCMATYIDYVNILYSVFIPQLNVCIHICT